MKRIDEIFNIQYGNQLDLNKCTICEKPEGYNFVNRSEKNCGVSARVLEEESKEPFPGGLITVAMGGSVLSSFVQQESFYTGQNVKVLTPKNEMSNLVKLYYCYCIELNRFRFSTFGREANYSFNSLLVPDLEEIPSDLNNIDIDNYTLSSKSITNKKMKLDANCWKYFYISDLFDVYASREENALNRSNGCVPFISSTQYSNGISMRVDDVPTIPKNTITVARNGSVGSAFYQPVPYCASPDDIRILKPKFELNKYIALFLITIIEKEKFRYGYGRKFGTKRINATKIKLPVTEYSTPDWEFMENYIKSLNYSKNM